MSDTLRNKCESCGCPDQLAGINCGFCGEHVEFPVGTLDESKGTVQVKEVIGWRAWDAVPTPDGARLKSPIYPGHGLWQPGVWEVAKCLRGGTDKGNTHTPDAAIDLQPPVKGCGGGAHGCGFYAGRTREHLMSMSYNRYREGSTPTVIGQVQMQGKIIPASNGWRAQMVRPRVLYVPYEFWQIGKELGEVYGPHGVEVKMDTTLILPKDAVPEWCPKCTAKWQGRGISCEFCGYTLNG